jgi:glycosyltransferase involved in cell wall biosynthesis
MPLTVLQVAYPLAPVSPDAVGGAEQVLFHLDRALVAAGHRSIVIAQEGSKVAGELVAVPPASGPLDVAAGKGGWERHKRAIVEALASRAVDLVHMHGIDFFAYLPPPGVPVLATLHAPRDWYPDEALRPGRPDTWLNCVSRAQHAECAPNPRLVDPIENGVPVEELSARHAKRGFALMLARIAPEKGVHLALDAAKAAGVPLLLAGEVFGYTEHRRYFDEEIAPRLDGLRRFVGPLGLERKRRFLSAARCLLVPSVVNETSSLVAREAIACGTPVIAFRKGALPETVEHGRTGFLVDDAAGMAEAIGRAHEIDPAVCRATARRRFSVERMSGCYLELYRSLAGSGRQLARA